jgi:hypothetical protein
MEVIILDYRSATVSIHTVPDDWGSDTIEEKLSIGHDEEWMSAEKIIIQDLRK